MKAVFPCKGVVVLTKKDLQSLKEFYKTTLNTTKMSEIYNSTEYSVQIGNFNYLPPNSKIVLNEENLLTITELRSIMGPSTITNQTQTISESSEDVLSDDDILSHPFFTTLKPID